MIMVVGRDRDMTRLYIKSRVEDVIWAESINTTRSDVSPSVWYTANVMIWGVNEQTFPDNTYPGNIALQIRREFME